MMARAFLLAALACCSAGAHAAEAVTPAAAGSLLQVALGLMLVLGLMAALAWLLRRAGLARPSGAAAIRIVGGVSLGSRERVVLLEVADQWIVVGVAAGRVSALSSMPRQALPSAAPDSPAPLTPNNFATRLRRALAQRHGY